MHGNFLHNSPKIKAVQISIHKKNEFLKKKRKKRKPILWWTHIKEYYLATKKSKVFLYTTTWTNVKKHNLESVKPGTKEYTLCTPLIPQNGTSKTNLWGRE